MNVSKPKDFDKIVQDAVIRSDYSAKTIDDMIMTLHDNPKLNSDDIERLVESAENILDAFYGGRDSDYPRNRNNGPFAPF